MSRKGFPREIYTTVIAIITAIDNDPLSRKRLSALIPCILLNRNKLQLTFREITGMPIARYRREKRMKAAANLLSGEEGLAIQQVAYKLGYKGKNGQSNFARDFKDVLKMTPTDWIVQTQNDHTENDTE